MVPGQCAGLRSRVFQRLFAGGFIVLQLVLPLSPVRAEGCRLALILALDVSGSVSADEHRLQREGLAAAFRAPEVRQAFLSGGDVAVYVFEWAGNAMQAPLLPGWVTVRSDADLLLVAAAIGQRANAGLRASVEMTHGTAMGSALVHAAAAFSEGPDCQARMVDVSGDGVNSLGIEPRAVIRTFYADITVNALIIDTPTEDPMQGLRNGGDLPLETWFERDVVHGPGAFYILVDSYDDYQRAMTAKLQREVQPALVSELPSPRRRI